MNYFLLCDVVFLANFGLEKSVVLDLWSLLQDSNPYRAFIIDHLFWALFFLKTYPTNAVGASHWHVDIKTYRTHLWSCLVLLFRCLQPVKYNYNYLIYQPLLSSISKPEEKR